MPLNKETELRFVIINMEFFEYLFLRNKYLSLIIKIEENLIKFYSTQLFWSAMESRKSQVWRSNMIAA